MIQSIPIIPGISIRYPTRLALSAEAHLDTELGPVPLMKGTGIVPER
jgi:hypothetical protein